ncbi:MAG TPA: BTAD domain-containing putative transcriptional regulator [Candidatus Sulfotelmatobacter sp.]|nr:BTAD domain-containing putative transcriptional regulator [Candidatus Sulfotelmatobacter sp.]
MHRSASLEPVELPRTALVERVRAAHPELIALAAPAGFGKTTLARQLLADEPHGVLAAPTRPGDLAFAAALLGALAQAQPERGADLARAAAALGDELVAPADRLALALAAWRVPTAPGWFALDELDGVSPELLTRLLADRPANRTLILCSRVPLRLHLSRFAAPHRIVSLRAPDLAFAPDEIAHALAGDGADPALAERIGAVSAGWPIAVLLLARFAREGRAGPLLERLDDLAYDELHEYLADQVLVDAPPGAIDGLLVAGALPDARDEDIAAALDDREALAEFAAFARSSPFVARGANGTIAVHPLAAATLRAAYAPRLEALLTRLAAAVRDRQPLRAADAFLAAGDRPAAASALAAVDDVEDGAPPLAYARVLSALGSSVVQRTPRLWAVTALLRAFASDGPGLLREADGVCARASRAGSRSGTVSLHVLRALLVGWLGDSEAGLAQLEELRATTGAAAPALAAWLTALHATVAARLGRLADAEAGFAATREIVQANDVVAGTVALAEGAEVARMRGERARERERLARAHERLRASGLGNVVALADAEAAFGAWLASEDALATEHARALDAAVEREGARAFAFFAAVACGRDEEPGPSDDPRWVARGWLVAAARAATPAHALERAERAHASARLDAAPFPQLLAALALAVLAPARRTDALAEAAAAAQRIDAPAVREAVAALARGVHGGALAPFVARYAGAQPVTASLSAGLAVDLVSGRVLRDGTPLTLPEREHALLTALAVRRDPIPRGRLTDALWPDLDESAARNAFHVCLHRLKTRLGEERVVVRTDEGYRLGDGVAVDLWEIDRAVTALRPGEPLDATRATALQALYERLRASRPARLEEWEWFEPTERRLRELRCEIAQALAQHALRAGDVQEALRLCHDMIAYDPCDEPARELAIRAYLAGGDRAAALRHFRQYREVLMAELQCEPSQSLARLVGATS